MSFFKKTIAITGILMITACAGRKPMPVATSQYGDEQLSCNSLFNEVSKSADEIRKLAIEQARGAQSNVTIGAASLIFLPVAAFAMDFGDAEEVEIKAYQQRANNLINMMYRKQCDPELIRRLPSTDVKLVLPVSGPAVEADRPRRQSLMD